MNRKNTVDLYDMKKINPDDTKNGFWLVSGQFDKLEENLHKKGYFNTDRNHYYDDFKKIYNNLSSILDNIEKPMDFVKYGVFWKLFNNSQYLELFDYSASTGHPELTYLSFALAYNYSLKKNDINTLFELSCMKDIVLDNLDN